MGEAGTQRIQERGPVDALHVPDEAASGQTDGEAGENKTAMVDDVHDVRPEAAQLTGEAAPPWDKPHERQHRSPSGGRPPVQPQGGRRFDHIDRDAPVAEAVGEQPVGRYDDAHVPSPCRQQAGEQMVRALSAAVHVWVGVEEDRSPASLTHGGRTVGPRPRGAVTLRRVQVAGVLAMGDLGDERCGVGGSLATLVDHMRRGRGAVTVVDTSGPGFRRFWRDARTAARTGAPCAGVYPTRSTVYEPRLLWRVVVLRLVFGRRRFRLQLHEYQRLRRMLRWPVTFAALLAGRVVVSSRSEQEALQRALRGLVGRRTDVVVAAPSNGTAATASEIITATALAATAWRTVGVFGVLREDKAAAWLSSTLERLDARFDRLVVAGSGWEDHRWSETISDRFTIEALGHVPRVDLAPVFSGWGLAVASLWGPANDGRMSLRTPLAFGVPTLSVGPPTDDLTLRPRHLFLTPPCDPSSIYDIDAATRRAGAEEVEAFEAAAACRLAGSLFG